MNTSETHCVLQPEDPSTTFCKQIYDCPPRAHSPEKHDSSKPEKLVYKKKGQQHKIQQKCVMGNLKKLEQMILSTSEMKENVCNEESDLLRRKAVNNVNKNYISQKNAKNLENVKEIRNSIMNTMDLDKQRRKNAQNSKDQVSENLQYIPTIAPKNRSTDPIAYLVGGCEPLTGVKWKKNVDNKNLSKPIDVVDKLTKNKNVITSEEKDCYMDKESILVAPDGPTPDKVFEIKKALNHGELLYSTNQEDKNKRCLSMDDFDEDKDLGNEKGEVDMLDSEKAEGVQYGGMVAEQAYVTGEVDPRQQGLIDANEGGCQVNNIAETDGELEADIGQECSEDYVDKNMYSTEKQDLNSPSKKEAMVCSEDHQEEKDFGSEKRGGSVQGMDDQEEACPQVVRQEDVCAEMEGQEVVRAEEGRQREMCAEVDWQWDVKAPQGCAGSSEGLLSADLVVKGNLISKPEVHVLSESLRAAPRWRRRRSKRRQRLQRRAKLATAVHILPIDSPEQSLLRVVAGTGSCVGGASGGLLAWPCPKSVPRVGTRHHVEEVQHPGEGAQHHTETTTITCHRPDCWTPDCWQVGEDSAMSLLPAPCGREHPCSSTPTGDSSGTGQRPTAEVKGHSKATGIWGDHERHGSGGPDIGKHNGDIKRKDGGTKKQNGDVGQQKSDTEKRHGGTEKQNGDASQKDDGINLPIGSDNQQKGGGGQQGDVAGKQNSSTSQQNGGSSQQNDGSSQQNGGSSQQNGGSSQQNGGSSQQDGGSSGQNGGSSQQNRNADTTHRDHVYGQQSNFPESCNAAGDHRPGKKGPTREDKRPGRDGDRGNESIDPDGGDAVGCEKGAAGGAEWGAAGGASNLIYRRRPPRTAPSAPQRPPPSHEEQPWLTNAHCRGNCRKLFGMLARKLVNRQAAAVACGELEKCLARCLCNERSSTCPICALIYTELKHVGTCPMTDWHTCDHCRNMRNLLKHHNEHCIVTAQHSMSPCPEGASHSSTPEKLQCRDRLNLCENLMAKIQLRDRVHALEEVWNTTAVWMRIKSYLRKLLIIPLVMDSHPDPMDSVSAPNFTSVSIRSIDQTQMSMVSRMFMGLAEDPENRSLGSQELYSSGYDWEQHARSNDHVKYGERHHLVVMGQAWQRLCGTRMRAEEPEEEEGIILAYIAESMRVRYPGGRYEEGKQWEVGPMLGTGMFGRCSLAMDSLTGFKFCVKEVPLDKFQQTEMETLTRLRHPNICLCYGALRTGAIVYILMEYVEGCSLHDHIKNHKRLNTLTALVYFKQLVKVLAYLQESGIVHEDIKSENILLQSGTTKLVLIDFGLARQLTADVKQVPADEGPVGSQTHWSPNKAKCAGYIFDADLWAAACVLLEMLSGSPPWIIRYAHKDSLMYIIATCSPPLADIPDYVPDDVRDLLVKLWSVAPDHPPSVATILSHPAFKRINDDYIRHVLVKRMVLTSGSTQAVEMHCASNVTATQLPNTLPFNRNISVVIGARESSEEISSLDRESSSSSHGERTDSPRFLLSALQDARSMSASRHANAVPCAPLATPTLPEPIWPDYHPSGVIPNLSIFGSNGSDTQTIQDSFPSTCSSVDLSKLMQELNIQAGNTDDYDLDDVQINHSSSYTEDFPSEHHLIPADTVEQPQKSASDTSIHARPSHSNSDIQSEYEELQKNLDPSLISDDEDEDEKAVPTWGMDNYQPPSEYIATEDEGGTLLVFMDGLTRANLSQLRVYNHNISWDDLVLRVSQQIHRAYPGGYSVTLHGRQPLDVTSPYHVTGGRVELEVWDVVENDDWFISDCCIQYRADYHGTFLV